nr:MAG TPA: hypothetical protein [Caudoviricetes sp.]
MDFSAALPQSCYCCSVVVGALNSKDIVRRVKGYGW